MRRISDTPPETIIPHGKIDDDHVGLVAAKKFIARRNVGCFEDGGAAGVLQNTSASLQNNWVVINNKDVGHTFHSGDRTFVEYHLEDRKLTVAQGHDIGDATEVAVKTLLPGSVEVTAHLEPLRINQRLDEQIKQSALVSRLLQPRQAAQVFGKHVRLVAWPTT
jgi:hypothetical protein